MIDRDVSINRLENVKRHTIYGTSLNVGFNEANEVSLLYYPLLLLRRGPYHRLGSR